MTAELPAATVQPLRLLIVVPSLKRAGAETQAVELANGLVKSGQAVWLFTFELETSLKIRLDERVQFISVPRVHKYDFAPIRALARVLAESSIDVVHSVMQFSGLVAWMAIRLSKKSPKLVIAIHTTEPKGIKEWLQDNLVYRFVFKRADQVLFVCKAQQKYWGQRFPSLKDNSTYIYNGINHDLQSDASSERHAVLRRNALGISADDFVFCCVAGLRPEKGHHLLLKAFSKIQQKAFLIIAGDGPLRDSLLAEAERLGIFNKVRFLGEVEGVSQVFCASDIMVLPSLAVETFSLALLESMSNGVPVIASRLGGAAEAICDGVDGFICPPRDLSELARLMESVVKERTNLKKMGSLAREKVRNQFTHTKMVAEHLELFTELRTSGQRKQIST